MLTNFKTIKQSIERLRKLSEMSADGTFERLPKKEVVKLSRELEKLEKNLAGIKDMVKPPKAIVIIDPKKEHIAVKEAHNLSIPVVAMLDTNCDPDEVDYPIPANDDSIRSIGLFVDKLAHACKEGDMLHQAELAERRQKASDKEEDAAKAMKTHKKTGPKVEVVKKSTLDGETEELQSSVNVGSEKDAESAKD